MAAGKKRRTLGRIADLGEADSIDRKFSSCMESGESENEGGGEKSGVHRGFFCGVTDEGGEGTGRVLRECTIYREDGKLRTSLPSNSPSSILGSATIRFLTVTGS